MKIVLGGIMQKNFFKQPRNTTGLLFIDRVCKVCNKAESYGMYGLNIYVNKSGRVWKGKTCPSCAGRYTARPKMIKQCVLCHNSFSTSNNNYKRCSSCSAQ